MNKDKRKDEIFEMAKLQIPKVSKSIMSVIVAGIIAKFSFIGFLGYVAYLWVTQ